MTSFIAAMLLLAGVPVLAACVYLATLAVLARRTRARAGDTSLRFAVVVPAHDEMHGIGQTVSSLARLDYPDARRRIIVVADNCTDETADRARAAGAEVLERTDTVRRGKGYALEYAFTELLEEGWADAVVVVDADTVVSANLLQAFGAAFHCGEQCAQAEYAVRNDGDSWRTQLMSIAFTAYHGVRSAGRERLGLSCGLRGNGMAFRRGLLQRVPHRAVGLVEDVEYGIALGLAGVRVAYVGEAEVLGEMPASRQGAASQRERWERGRATVLKLHLRRLLTRALVARDRVCLDLAIDLLVPPLTRLAALVAAGCAASILLMIFGIGVPWVAVPWGLAAAGLLAYVARACQRSPAGGRAFLTLLWVPVYALWKLSLSLRRSRRSDDWVRTRRANE